MRDHHPVYNYSFLERLLLCPLSFSIQQTIVPCYCLDQQLVPSPHSYRRVIQSARYCRKRSPALPVIQIHEPQEIFAISFFAIKGKSALYRFVFPLLRGRQFSDRGLLGRSSDSTATADSDPICCGDLDFVELLK